MNEQQLESLTNLVKEITQQSRVNHQLQQQLDVVKAMLQMLCTSPVAGLSFAFEVCQSHPGVSQL